MTYHAAQIGIGTVRSSCIWYQHQISMNEFSERLILTFGFNKWNCTLMLDLELMTCTCLQTFQVLTLQYRAKNPHHVRIPRDVDIAVDALV